MTDEALPSSNRAIVAAGDRFRDEKEVPGDRDLLLAYRSFVTVDLAETFAFIRERLEGVPALLSLRVKRLDSIVRKLRREPAMNLVRMDDIIGFRIIVPSLAHQSAVFTSFEAEGSAHKTRDYREEAHAGYRATHLIFRRELQLPGAQATSMYPFEVQLRTYYQHLWASTSESFGERVKEGGGSRVVRDYLDQLSSVIAREEDRDPAALQMEEIHQASGLALYALKFDHRSKAIDILEEFDADVGRGLAYFGYLESRSRDDLSQEIVLLGCSSSLEELKVTHLRYFQPRGMPELPERIRNDLPRPEAQG